MTLLSNGKTYSVTWPASYSTNAFGLNSEHGISVEFVTSTGGSIFMTPYEIAANLVDGTLKA